MLIPTPSTYLDVVTSAKTGYKVCFCRREDFKFYLVYVLVVEIAFTNVIPIFAIVIISMAIGFVLLRQKRMRQQISSSGDSRKENQALMQVALILASFLVGYIPKMAHFIQQSVHPMDSRMHAITYMIAVGIRSLTESMNPIIYASCSHDFPRYLKNCLRGVSSTNGNAEPQSNPSVSVSCVKYPKDSTTKDLKTTV